MRDHNFLFILTIFALLLTNCNRTLQKDDIMFSNGKYYEKGREKPYSGKVTYYFPNGEGKSGERYFIQGILHHTTSFGYQGEIIIEDRFLPVELTKKIDADIDRVTIVETIEGIPPAIYSVIIILKKEISRNNYEQLCAKVMEYLEDEGYFSGKKSDFPLKKGNFLVTVRLGDIEERLWEARY